ncbi:3-oxoacyl-[acyl-carrier-protein] synthase I, chloroplastic-like isoform X3 [Salvia hispanica]|uniref:3-oxoacyl-[acyl-carrier-protein] synthase I, chloroplastic-like isoform X3 n=1 Tax=Salvia hispanica TaxID=49212 RepID=UPI0020094E08|nr:3-oxoacyl-[acyl-carrier-protein] synthase I, chloroplastic-like isoform X3 [Salvia hispanica]
MLASCFSTLLTQSANPKLFLTTSSARNGKKIKAMASNSSPKRETDPKKRIVITGMGLVSVFGSDIDVYYNKLLAGESGITLIDRFDTSDFSVKIAGQIRGFSSEGYINGKDDRRLDDCWRYCLVAGKRALDDANLGKKAVDTMDKTRMGVLVGSAMGGNTIYSDGIEGSVQKGPKNISPFFIPYSISNMGSALLAIDAGFMGPTYSISTACATANHCFIAAANHIRRGEADVMVAGASDAGVTVAGVGGCTACRALSLRNNEPHKASRPWDIHRDGFVMGEGAGILIMERMDHAMRRGARVYAEYLGGAASCDAHHITDPQPDGLGVASCMIKSLKDAGVDAQEVNYVNTHATSTRAGDLPEVKAIKRVFNNTSELKINSTKSIIGHGLGAAGGLEAIATIKAINTGWLHPTLNQDELEAEVTIDTVPNVKKQHQINVAISNSFGFGGHNSVAVFAPFSP